MNWEDQSGTNDAGQVRGTSDAAQFLAFSGLVTGSVGADILMLGPGSAVTLDGSGFFSQINIGQDINGDVGQGTLVIGQSGGGNVVAATILNIGSVRGGIGTLIANGTFSSTGAVSFGAPEVAGTTDVNAGGEFAYDGNLSMFDGGSNNVASSGRFVVGSGLGAGVAGAVAIDSGKVLTGTGTISGNVADNGRWRPTTSATTRPSSPSTAISAVPGP